MSKLWLVALVAVAGCGVCDSRVTRQADAPRAAFSPQIAQCMAQHDCEPLCRQLFAIDPATDIETCTVTKLQATSAHVVAKYVDESTCSGDDSDSVDVSVVGDTDDGSTDDGSDDGSTTAATRGPTTARPTTALPTMARPTTVMMGRPTIVTSRRLTRRQGTPRADRIVLMIDVARTSSSRSSSFDNPLIAANLRNSSVTCAARRIPRIVLGVPPRL